MKKLFIITLLLVACTKNDETKSSPTPNTDTQKPSKIDPNNSKLFVGSKYCGETALPLKRERIYLQNEFLTYVEQVSDDGSSYCLRARTYRRTIHEFSSTEQMYKEKSRLEPIRTKKQCFDSNTDEPIDKEVTETLPEDADQMMSVIIESDGGILDWTKSASCKTGTFSLYFVRR